MLVSWDWDLTVALKGDGWGRQHFYTQSTQSTLYWGELQEAMWEIQLATLWFYTWTCWQVKNSGWSCPRWQDRKISHGVTTLMILGRAKGACLPWTKWIPHKITGLGGPGGSAVWCSLWPRAWSWKYGTESHVGLPGWSLLLPLPVSLPLSLSVSHE